MEQFSDHIRFVRVACHPFIREFPSIEQYMKTHEQFKKKQKKKKMSMLPAFQFVIFLIEL